MQSLDKVRELVLSKYKDQHQNRLNHILGVVEMASYLSYIYNINKDKAMIAAYMHDYCKYDDYNDAKNVLSKEDIEECEEYPFLYHAYMSAEAYKNIIGDDEEEEM